MNRREIIRERERLNRRFENKYYPKLQKAIKSQISSLIETVKKSGVEAGINEATQIITSPVAPIVEELYNEVGLQYARKQWRIFLQQRRQQKRFGFNSAWVNFIKDFLYRFLMEKIVFNVSRTTREAILTVLQKSVSEGWGIEETLKQLEGLPISKTQAARIVRTEITRAANTGTMAAGETFEYEQTKEWIAAHDSRTRGVRPNDHASHIGLDGVVINYDEEFTDPRNGDKLRYPGDPKASAESTVNCRCTIAVVAKVDENGRLIPKRSKIREKR